MCSKAVRNWTQCSPALDNGKKILMTPKFWLQAQNSMNKEQHTHRKRPWMSVIRKRHHLPTCSSVSEVLLLDIQHTRLPNHGQTSHTALHVSIFPLPSLASSDHYHHQSDSSLDVKFCYRLSNCFHFIVNMITAMCPAAGFYFFPKRKQEAEGRSSLRSLTCLHSWWPSEKEIVGLLNINNCPCHDHDHCHVMMCKN